MRRAAPWLPLSIALSGCNAIFGVGDYAYGDGGSAGAPASGGGAAGGGEPCEPVVAPACYEGPRGTEDVGVCHGGTRACNALPEAPCEGQVLPSADTCATPTDDDCDGFACDTLSSLRYGDEDGQYPTTLDVGDDGFAIAGTFLGSLDVGAGSLTAGGFTDLFIARFDATGAALWSVAFGGDGYDEGRALALTADGVVVAGTFAQTMTIGGDMLVPAGNYDAFVVKLDQNGAPLWSSRHGGTMLDAARQLDVGPDGTIAVAGNFSGNATFAGVALQGAANDVFLMTLESTGENGTAWKYGDADEQSVRNLAYDADGNLYLGGAFKGMLDFGAIAIGTGNNVDAGWVARIDDTDGSAVWAVAVVGDEDVEVSGLAPAGGDRVYVSGRFSSQASFGDTLLSTDGDDDVFVARIDAGEVEWALSFGDDEDQRAFDVALDPAGGAIVTGAFGGTLDFGGDALVADGSDSVFVAAFDEDGVHRWSKAYPSAGQVEQIVFATTTRRRVGVDSAGTVVLSGFSVDDLTVDGETIPGAGNSDGFLLRLR